MAGTNDINKEAGLAGEVADADILNALGLDENLNDIGTSAATEDEPARTEQGAEEEGDTVTDKGHGSEVQDAEESAGGENAGDDEEAGQEEETEEETDSQEESEEQEEESEEEERPKGIREMEKRIHKLTAKSKGLEEENSTLKKQLEEAQPITLSPSEDDPLSSLTTEQDVAKQVKAQRVLRAWCIENLDGGEIELKDGTKKELSGAEVRKRLARADDIIQHYGPERLKYLQLRGQYDAITRGVYPSLYEATSEESQIANRFLLENPGILRLPNYALIIGDAIRGMRIREQEQKQKKASGAAATKKPAAAATFGKPKLAPRAIRPGAAKTIRANGASNLEQKFMETGDKDALVGMIASTL